VIQFWAEHLIVGQVFIAMGSLVLLPSDTAPSSDLVVFVQSHELIFHLLEANVHVPFGHPEEVEVVSVERRGDIDQAEGKEVDESIVEVIEVQIVVLVQLEGVQIELSELVGLDGATQIYDREDAPTDLLVLNEAVDEVVV